MSVRLEVQKARADDGCLKGNGDLQVTVTRFVNNVHCYGSLGGPGIVNSCDGIANRMSTSSVQLTFGPITHDNVDVVVPYGLQAGTRYLQRGMILLADPGFNT